MKTSVGVDHTDLEPGIGPTARNDSAARRTDSPGGIDARRHAWTAGPGEDSRPTGEEAGWKPRSSFLHSRDPHRPMNIRRSTTQWSCSRESCLKNHLSAILVARSVPAAQRSERRAAGCDHGADSSRRRPLRSRDGTRPPKWIRLDSHRTSRITRGSSPQRSSEVEAGFDAQVLAERCTSSTRSGMRRPPTRS